MLADRFLTPFRILVLSLAASPVFFLGAFYNYVVAARLYLGYWPQYNRPDPKWLGWSLPYNSLWLGLMCIPYALGFAGLLMLAGRCCSEDFPIIPALAIAGISFIAFLACLLIDPSGFFNWFFD